MRRESTVFCAVPAARRCGRERAAGGAEVRNLRQRQSVRIGGVFLCGSQRIALFDELRPSLFGKEGFLRLRFLLRLCFFKERFGFPDSFGQFSGAAGRLGRAGYSVYSIIFCIRRALRGLSFAGIRGEFSVGASGADRTNRGERQTGCGGNHERDDRGQYFFSHSTVFSHKIMRGSNRGCHTSWNATAPIKDKPGMPRGSPRDI